MNMVLWPLRKMSYSIMKMMESEQNTVRAFIQSHPGRGHVEHINTLCHILGPYQPIKFFLYSRKRFCMGKPVSVYISAKPQIN